MLEALSSLMEPVNLVLIMVCAILLYKVLFGGESGREEPTPEPEVEKVEGNMTVKQLLEYNGMDPRKPVLLAVCGKIYDVTRGKRFYGPGGPYDILAGHDATRALSLMSTDPKDVKDVDDDLSDLKPGELASAREWQQSMEFKYDYVGLLVKESELGDSDTKDTEDSEVEGEQKPAEDEQKPAEDARAAADEAEGDLIDLDGDVVEMVEAAPADERNEDEGVELEDEALAVEDEGDDAVQTKDASPSEEQEDA